MDILKIKIKPLLLKCLVLLISAVMIFSVCSVGININTLAEGAQNQFWSGNTVSGYADFEGKGTDKEPYLIKTPEQLAFAVGKNPALGDHIYYKLANDIKINDTSKANWEASAKSWKRYDHARFGGVLDGDGYTIDGLYISTNTTTGRYGFISYIGGPKNGSYVAEVKNLKFTNASINHTATSTASNLQGMAVVAGQTSGKVIFEKIYVDATCKVNAPNVKGVAGIAGRGYDNGNNADPTIKNCTVLATITGNTHVGAIVGSYWAADANVTIEKCFAVTNIGLVGAKSNATVSITDTYTTTLGSLDTGATQVDAENMKGENAKTAMPKLDFVNVWQTVDGGYPVLKFAANNTPSSTPAWDGTAAESYAGGLGTQESPWKIETAAQLFKMVKENTTVNTDAAFAEMKYFKITKDIVINPVTAEDMVNPTVAAWDAKGYKTWNPGYTGNQNSNGFYGVVDGGGHTISGLYVKEGQYVGLIPVIVDNASITNIKVTNSFVRASSGSASPGIIVGIVYGKKNNYPTFDLTYSSIDNCYVLADATSSWRIGGLVGGAYDAKKITISDCSATNLKMHTTNTGTVGRTGAFIGNVGSGSHVVKNCFTDASTHPVSNTTDTQTNYDQLHKYITWTNVYTAAAKPSFDKYNDITYLTADQMKGEAAKSNMSNFDFEKVWQTVDGGYPVLRAPKQEAEQTPVWDGTKDSNLEGKGTEDEPYLIKTPAQLAYIVTANNGGAFTGKHFKLANDIRINDTSKANWKASARNWVWEDFRFIGTFDGDGHTIDGLYYKGSQRVMGLFSYVGASNDGAHKTTLKNFKMTNAYIESTAADGVGFAAGQASRVAYFEGIYIEDTCEIKATCTGVGGILGQSGYNVFMSNIAMNGKVAGGSNVGAFAGTISSGAKLDIKSSYTTADLYAQGVTDRNLATASVSVYVVKKQGTVDAAATLLTADQMKGENAKTNMTGLDFETVFETVKNDYPIINVREPAVPPTAPLWDGTKDSNLEGEGTEEKPYLIKTPEQLAYVVATDLPDGKHFKLANDIRIHDTTKANWKESARNWLFGNVRFTGTFDGDGHTIEGLYYKGKQQRMGLFSYVGADDNGVYETTIKNFKLSGAHIENDNTGAATKLEGTAFIAPQTERSATFEHIYIDESCTLVAKNFKGVAGIAARGSSSSVVTVTINECAMLGKIQTTDCSLVGAFFGTYWRSATVLNINGSFTSSDKPITGEHALGAAANNYSVTADNQGTNVVTEDQMKGLAAETNMSGLNFEATWKAVENGFPVIDLRDVTPPPPLPDYVWDGTKAESFAGGDGSEDAPFLIENAEQLYKMVVEYSNRAASAGKYFKITDDIYINNVESGNSLVSLKHKNNWLYKYGTEVPTASKDNSFCGILDGGFHKIYGLYVTGVKSAGLFPSLTSGVEIKNLAFDNLYITGGSGTAGAVAGQVIYADWTKANKITNCSVVNATIGDDGNIESVGGIIGDTRDNSITFTNCYSHTVSLSDWKIAGGIVGNAWSDGNKVTLVTCYSIGYFPVRSDINKVICTDVYSDTAAPTGNTTEGVTVLANAKFKGDVAKDNLNNFDFNRIWKVVENGYPAHFEYKRPANVWDGKTAESFAGGSGTPYDPYLIENGAQLYKMVKEYSNASGASGAVNKQTYFKLISDIYLNDINENDMINPTVAAWNSKFNTWYTCTSYSKGFCGELDGDGYTVYGLYSNTGYSGLIPNLMDGGSVHNLNLKNSYIRGTESAGSIVGFVKAHWKMAPVTVSYCTVDNVVIESTKKYVGGLIGGFGDIKITANDCAVTNAKFRTTDEFADYATGIIGVGWGELTQKVTNCFTDSTISPVTYIAPTAKYKVEYTNVYTSSAKKGSVKGVTYLANDGKLQGANVSKVLKGFDFKNDWSATDSYPVIKKGAGLWKYDNNAPGQTWSGKLARYYASGDGSKATPYEIKTAGQLALLANDALNGKTTDKYYKITANIYINDTSKENWQETAKEWFTGSWAKAFRGKLDGNYHIISGLYLNKTKDTYDGTDYYGGLFAAIGQGAVIQRLGIVDSSLTFNFTKHSSGTTHLGAFAGFVDQYDAKKAKFSEYPLISECFADTGVYLEGGTTGGIIGDATRPVRVENSFFTGKVKSTSRGLFGYSKMNNDYGVVLVKNFYAADSKYAVLSNVSYDNFIYENCYASSSQDTNGVTRLFIDRMCGEEALKYMTGLDFEKIWCVRAADETPGLKGFKQNLYSNKMSPEDITVSFETNCDLEVKSITGKAYSKLELPVLEREGYTFDGWYAYPELDTPFTYDYFPTFDTILYAKWTINGFLQDFEQYENTVYDYHEGIDYFRPTSVGYSAKYVHGGGKAMHRLAGGADYRDFLIFYEEELEVGKTYKMVFYTTTDQDKAAVDVSLVHLEHPDVYSANKGVKKVDKLKNLTDGEWTETTYTFTAKSKWVAIRTAGDASIYIDDVAFFESDNASVLAGFFGTVWGIITLVGAAVILAGGAVAFIFIRKRK